MKISLRACDKIAATDDASRFDLLRFLVLDLMYINADGCIVLPIGGAITGCINEHKFFHPVWAMQGVDENVGLEAVLEQTVATQHLEVALVFTGGEGREA